MPIVVEVAPVNSTIAEFYVPAVDPDGDEIRWRFATPGEHFAFDPEPPNMTINPLTGLVTWDTALLDQNDFWTVQFMVEDLDENGAVKTKTPIDFLLKIQPRQIGQNEPVCMLGPPGNPAPPVIEVEAGSPMMLQARGDDPDQGDQLTLAIAGLPALNAFMSSDLPLTSGNNVTSTLHWTPTPDQVGSYIVVFSVTDQTGLQSICFRTIRVMPGANMNNAPLVSINPPGPLTVTAGTPVTYSVAATDPDASDVVTLDTPGLPASAGMNPVLPATGPASGIISAFSWTPTEFQVGPNVVTYTATDLAGLQSTASITINVVPPSPPALAFSPPGPLTLQARATVSFRVTAADPDATDIVTLASGGLPVGINSNPALPVSGPASGVSSFATWKPTVQQLGQHVLPYTATDNTGRQVTGSIRINVVPPGVNKTPLIALNPPGPLTVMAGTSVTVGVTGTDPDADDIVTVTSASLPAGTVMSPVLPTSGPASGVTSTFTWAPPQTGTTVVTFTATDILGAQAVASLTIEATNRPPMADAGPDTTIECMGIPEGTQVTLDGTGSFDPDGDAITSYVWTGPFGTTEGATPTVTLPFGEHVIALTVTDVHGATDTDEVVVTLGDMTPPVITLGLSVELWPPNHKYHTINIADCVVSVVDACMGEIDLSQIHIVSVSSDEPEDVQGEENCKSDKSTKSDKSGKSVKSDKSKKSGKSVQSTKSDKSKKSGKSVQSTKSDKSSKSSKVTRSRFKKRNWLSVFLADRKDDDDDKSKKSSKSSKSSKSGNSSKSGKSEKSSKSDKSGKSCKDGGDGHTLNDIVIADDCQSVQVRSERLGGGNGRVYTINIEVDDGNGNVATAACKITVPHDQKPGHVAVDDGPEAGYTVYCGDQTPPVAMTGARKTNKTLVVADEDEEVSEEVEEVEVVEKVLAPTEFTLKPSYPNPFNPSTTIAYEVPQQAHVVLEVYNLLGQVVVRLIDEAKAPGRYSVTWHGRNAQGLSVASGVYLYRMVTSAGFVDTQRMTLLK